MGKRLKKYTSIPPELYVNRSADGQLKRIVDEMQRPGYVLVARQMGKTNLLINAKRTLENENRLFVYVDLSNLFSYERDCYRNIIDNILEPNIKLFGSIESKIDALRKEELPPHKEYSKSLRIVLDHFQGDVVIVLDEIDALRTADYSDNIFAQIRSNYFSRTNFPEFERLTYILSGVIEPTDLIKDRNKSPFNIGDKIYLEDFSVDEHNSFIQKSGLNILEDTSEEIYKWTRGNPRLTFDICSVVESYTIENGSCSIEVLGDLIRKKYLTSYDISPIDHIRELVRGDRKIRQAILKIHRGESLELSDEIKKKLYLYGIINSKFDEITKIKNPIIEKSLSNDWIKSIDKQVRDNFSYGLDLMDQFEFKEAIDILTEFIENSNPNDDQLNVCYYNIGFAYYSLNEYHEAIKYLSKELQIEPYKRNAKSLLGISHLGIGEKEVGKEILEGIIQEKIYDFSFRNAVINYAPIISSTDKTRALDLYEELFQSTQNNVDKVAQDELDKVRTLSQYFKAELLFNDNKIDETLLCIDKALDYSNSSDSLYLKFSKYRLSEEKSESLKSEILETIIDQNLKFDTKNSYSISFSSEHLYSYLDLYFDPQNLTQFEKLLQYSFSQLFDKKVSKGELVYQSSKLSNQREILLKYILDHESDADTSSLVKVYHDLAGLSEEKNSTFFEYFNKYLELFQELDTLESKDIYLIARAVKNYSDINEISRALELCGYLEVRLENVKDEELKFESVIIYYWIASLNFSLKKRQEAILYSDKTIQLIKESKKERTSMIDEKGLKTISDQMYQIKNSSIIRKPIVTEKKYSRNDRVKVKYQDGRIIEDKYKKLEADILAERCEVLKTPSNKH